MSSKHPRRRQSTRERGRLKRSSHQRWVCAMVSGLLTHHDRQRSAPDDMNAEDAVGLLLRQELDHTLRVLVSLCETFTTTCFRHSVRTHLCSAVGNEREFADGVVDLVLLQVLFSLADPCNLCNDDQTNGQMLKVWVRHTSG